VVAGKLTRTSLLAGIFEDVLQQLWLYCCSNCGFYGAQETAVLFHEKLSYEQLNQMECQPSDV
jgi:hypothetical protein